MVKKWLLATLVILLAACSDNKNHGDDSSPASSPVSTVAPPQNISYSVVNIYPHDTSAFTQGLVYHNSQIYEGTGQYRESRLRKIEYASGKIKQEISLDTSLFGEGITRVNETLYQLTWKEHSVLVYRAKDFKLLRKLNWSREGWGITNDGSNLIVSDGTDKLYYVRPFDFSVTKVLSVFDNLGPVNNLNELEYIDGFIYANRWETDYVLKIEPASGRVAGLLDFTDALKKYANIDYDERTEEEGAVLNGIAWDSLGHRMFITGKLWPKILEIKLN